MSDPVLTAKFDIWRNWFWSRFNSRLLLGDYLQVVRLPNAQSLRASNRAYIKLYKGLLAILRIPPEVKTFSNLQSILSKDLDDDTADQLVDLLQSVRCQIIERKKEARFKKKRGPTRSIPRQMSFELLVGIQFLERQPAQQKRLKDFLLPGGELHRHFCSYSQLDTDRINRFFVNRGEKQQPISEWAKAFKQELIRGYLSTGQTTVTKTITESDKRKIKDLIERVKQTILSELSVS